MLHFEKRAKVIFVLKVALVGKPNVGKSSLFNRLTKSFDAIISDVAGTTRDVKRGLVANEGQPYMLYDTGGIEDRDEMFDNVKKRSLEAADDADIILFMVDGKNGWEEKERKLFFALRKKNPLTALVINKIDNDKEQLASFEMFAPFAATHTFTISIAHNRKLNELQEWIDSFIPQDNGESDDLDLQEDDDDMFDFLDDDTQQEDWIDEENNLDEELPYSTEHDEIKVAIIGRVNVGKSSLLNALVGHERSVVSSIAGTTIDPVDETIEHNGRLITFIDTAGIRRRSKIVGIEKWALDRSKKVLKSANVALLVLDASEDVKELDERVAGLIDEYKTGAVIILNKWDERTKEFEAWLKDVRYRFKFLYFAPVISISAKSGQRVHKILDLIVSVYTNYAQKISTKKLTDLIKEASTKHYLPSVKGKFARISFAVQYRVKPITIAIVMNYPEALHFSYKRYLINMLRENFSLEGAPIVINGRKKGRKEGDDEDE